MLHSFTIRQHNRSIVKLNCLTSQTKRQFSVLPINAPFLISTPIISCKCFYSNKRFHISNIISTPIQCYNSVRVHLDQQRFIFFYYLHNASYTAPRRRSLYIIQDLEWLRVVNKVLRGRLKRNKKLFFSEGIFVSIFYAILRRGTLGVGEHRITAKKFDKYRNTAKKIGKYRNFIVSLYSWWIL